MAGPEAVLDFLVVARALILVLDQKTDGCAGGLALEHTGKDAHRITLAPLSRVLRGTGTAAVHVLLQVRFGDRKSRRTAVDDAPQGRPVALAEARHREHPSERISSHALIAPSSRPP